MHCTRACRTTREKQREAEQRETGKNREKQGEAGRSRKKQGEVGRSREKQGEAGRNREKQGEAGRNREKQGEVRWRMFDSYWTWGTELEEFVVASGEVSGRESECYKQCVRAHPHLLSAARCPALVWGLVSEEL